MSYTWSLFLECVGLVMSNEEASPMLLDIYAFPLLAERKQNVEEQFGLANLEIILGLYLILC